MRLSVPFVIALLSISSIQAQDTSKVRIAVSGKVVDAEHQTQALFDLMIVNQNTGQGFFGRTDGTFKTAMNKNDTLMISASGYEILKFCFRDSAYNENYFLNIALRKLSVQLPEVDIFSQRELESIEKDIQKLGYDKRDYELSGVDALQSPITFLYQQFSRKEQLRRHNLELVNAQKRRILLKELLHRYASSDIIQLSDDAFDAFIDFAQVPEAFMKNSTQYEFMVYIKEKYKLFMARNDYYREKQNYRSNKNGR